MRLIGFGTSACAIGHKPRAIYISTAANMEAGFFGSLVNSQTANDDRTVALQPRIDVTSKSSRCLGACIKI